MTVGRASVACSVAGAGKRRKKTVEINLERNLTRSNVFIIILRYLSHTLSLLSFEIPGSSGPLQAPAAADVSRKEEISPLFSLEREWEEHPAAVRARPEAVQVADVGRRAGQRHGGAGLGGRRGRSGQLPHGDTGVH